MKQIQLSKSEKGGQILYAMVDDADYEWLNKYSWTWVRSRKKEIGYYAKRRAGNKSIYMHREILGLTNPKQMVDHEDHDSLNNQRINLRVCSNAENQKNKSPHGVSRFLGVSAMKVKRQQKSGVKVFSYWRAGISDGKKILHLGSFKTEEEAARAYDEKAKQIHGKFANLNFKAA